MMKAKWIIEDGNLEAENWDRIVAYLKQTGREYKRVKYRPFTCDPLNAGFEENDCVVVFGCLGMMRAVNRNHAWIPGVWCDFNQLKCSYYLAHWGEYSIHGLYGLYPLAEVKRNKHLLWVIYSSHYGELSDHIFIRPDDNFKSFNGELVAPENWDRFLQNVSCYQPDDTTLCLVSRPTEITDEWRMIIADRKVLTGSQYVKNKDIALSAEVDPLAIEFAEKVVNSTEWQPHPMFSFDVCKTANGEYKMMEIGGLNSSGLYECDIEKVVEKTCEIAEREWENVWAPV